MRLSAEPAGLKLRSARGRTGLANADIIPCGEMWSKDQKLLAPPANPSGTHKPRRSPKAGPGRIPRDLRFRLTRIAVSDCAFGAFFLGGRESVRRGRRTSPRMISRVWAKPSCRSAEGKTSSRRPPSKRFLAAGSHRSACCVAGESKRVEGIIHRYNTFRLTSLFRKYKSFANCLLRRGCMQSSKPIFLLAFVFFVSTAVHAQQPPTAPPAVRDPAAVAAIQRALAALGGSGVLGQVRDCVAHGNIQVSEGSALTGGSFVWKTAGTEFRYETPSPAGIHVFASGHGRAATLQNGVIESKGRHVRLAAFPPHLPGVLLLNVLSDAQSRLTYVGTGLVGTTPAVRVRTSVGADALTAAITLQEWLLDSSTGLPLRVEFQLFDSANRRFSMKAAFEFSNFRAVSGVLVPFRIATFHNRELNGVASLSSVAFNTGLNASEFDLAPGGAK